MIVLGIILLIAGFLLKISILWTIGIILLVIGVVLAILGSRDALSAAGATTSNPLLTLGSSSTHRFTRLRTPRPRPG